MTLADKVYEGIQSDILMGRYGMNEFLVEAEIAKKYGVSKGTAGEALHRLCLEGQLMSYPRKGYLLALVTEKEFAKLMRLRIVLEKLAADILIKEKTQEERRQLAKELSPGAIPTNMQFHMKLCEATGDKFLVSAIYCTLSALARSERYVTASRGQKGIQYHGEILEAIVEGEYERAASYIEKDARGQKE